MSIYSKALLLCAIATLTACGGDNDNSKEINALEAELQSLRQEISNMNAGNNDDVTVLEARIEELSLALTLAKDSSDAELAALESELTSLQAELDALTYASPMLGENATQGVNILPEDNGDKVWRFAVFPDTQGRDDDQMKVYAHTDRDGNELSVSEWIGVDFNGDGYYDAGTKSQNDSVKAGDWDEDGISYLVNVTDPFHPFIETSENGEPIVVAPEDRKDYGPDWKILPYPLTDAVTDKMIELGVDLVLATGDITEYRAESDYVQWMEKVAAPLKAAGISVFPVRGNHEVVNGRNWPAWFTNEQEWERQSVNNVYNGINPYDGYEQVDFDQGYQLYKAYSGSLVQEHIASGQSVGFPGAEDLVYYFVNENTLFIGIDFYFAQLYNSAYYGTWITLRDWLTDVITTQGPNVDHVVVYGHEPLSTKKRPQTYIEDIYESYNAQRALVQAQVEQAQANLDAAIASMATDAEITLRQVSLEEATSAYEELDEPGVIGYDIGQLGYLLLQDDSEPGLAKDILSLFSKYKVTYISGHDHQYARSLIHNDASQKDSSLGFTQIIGGNASWKAYENLYGINDEYETGLFVKNFFDSVSGGDLVNSEGLAYANVTSELGKGISFVLVEVNGRQMTTTAYYTPHSLTEVDMNLGAYYDTEANAWCRYSGDYMVADSLTVKTCTAVDWQIVDQATHTTDATARIVEPYENYFITTKTPSDEGYIGSEASIVDGYNLTFDASYAANIDRLEMMRELLNLSWFTDTNETTVSDVLWISGNQTQDGSYFSEYGDVTLPIIDVDTGVLALGEAPSLTYVNRSLVEVNNPTHVSRDGVMTKGTDIEASLNPDIVNGNPSGDGGLWTHRYLSDGLDFADAMTIVFTAPEGLEVTDLILARYDNVSASWVPVFAEACYIESGYSEHFSAQYRISEQHPEGGNEISNCQQRYWGYTKASNTIWGFIHTDGKFALISKESGI